MFNFFSSKHTVSGIDFNQIKVDIHSHLIPSIDDGAKNIQDSIELIKGLRDLGYQKIITTPHVYTDYYPNSSEVIKNGHQFVQSVLVKQGIDISLEVAAEYFIDEHFLDLLSKKSLLTFGGNFVLIEMSFYSEYPRILDVIFKMRLAGYSPILAHPERYLYYSNDIFKLKEIKETGCRLQLNLLSLTQHYGKDVYKLATKLLKEGMYDHCGTDTHNQNHIQKLTSLKNTRLDSSVIELYNCNDVFL